MLKTVYLAGPISGLTYAEAAGTWRDYVADALDASGGGVTCLSPLRGKEYLSGSGKLEKQYLTGNQLSTAQGIVRRDFNDVKTCDAVFANLMGATRASLGTCWELGVAYALQKPVVLCIDKDSVHDHIFLTQTATYTFQHDLDEALDALLYLLGE